MIDKENAIRWFENIANECDKLTSGNVAHLKAQIKGMAIRSVEYLKKHSQEPASEDLEQAAIDYDSCRPALYGEDDEGDYVEYIEVRKDAFIAGAEWQEEQMQLTWQDIQRIVKIADQMVDEDEDGRLLTMGEEDYYKEVLERYLSNRRNLNT